MTQSPPPISRQTITPEPRRPLIALLPMAAAVLAALFVLGMIAMLIVDSYYEEHRYDRLQVGDLGMIRMPGTWNDAAPVSYRDWTPDEVVIAVPPPYSTADDRYAAGRTCRVHGSTLVRIEAWYRWDVLLKIVGRVDPGDQASTVDDCPEGAMFVANAHEAEDMLANERIREDRRRTDSVLTNGRLLPAWNAPRARLILHRVP